MSNVQDRIREDVQGNKIVIYMKGTPETPRCGFSAAAIQVLQTLNQPFKAVDVLSDPEVWEGVKQYSDWPTIPQIFIGGQFLGGCDILREMHAKGELQPVVAKAMGTSA